MGNIGLGVIVIGVFLVIFMFTWSLRHAFNTAVWFSVAWMLTLLGLYLADAAGYGYISIAPTGPAGAVGLAIAALIAYFYHRRWKKIQLEKKIQAEKERARRRAAGEPEPSLLGNVFRAINKARSPDR